jgi:hypothetical protein
MAEHDTVVAIPPATKEDQPFQVGNEVTVYEAAMVYSGRHPYPKFFGLDGRRSEREPRGHRSQRSWDIYNELLERIQRGLIKPIKPAYDLAGKIDGARTIVHISDLVQLAVRRREQPKYLRHLLNFGSRASMRPMTKTMAGKFAAEYIKREKLAGRRPTILGLERSVEGKFRGGRDYLREAFRQIEGPV